jgi:hypothetical protein
MNGINRATRDSCENTRKMPIRAVAQRSPARASSKQRGLPGVPTLGACAFLTPSLVLEIPRFRPSRVSSGQDPLRQTLGLLRRGCFLAHPGRPGYNRRFMAAVSFREEPFSGPRVSNVDSATPSDTTVVT